MRPSLLPGLVATAARNIRHGVKSLRFFELGRVFRHNGGGKSRDHETDSLGILLAGPIGPESWCGTPPLAAMHDLRAILHALLPGRDWQFTPRARDGFALACDVTIGDINVGIAARLLPAREREIDSSSPIYACELDLA
jgi:phenylalanyl-tRNA synthetase beta chain